MKLNSRRKFLQLASHIASGSVVGSLFGPNSLELLLAGTAGLDDDLLGVLPFVGEARPAFGQVTGKGLAGRLIYDLGRIEQDHMVTPTDVFYVRTAAPDGIDFESKRHWTVAITGSVAKPTALLAEDLVAAAMPLGTHVMECSGNGPHRAFGLLSAAGWSGVSLQSIIAAAEPTVDATHVMVVGHNNHSDKGSDRNANKSWVLPLASLGVVKAFLATHMNGKILPRDHGYPLRMIVPGWYGCTCIKWVHELRLIGDDEPATAQMQLYAGRTHQQGVPNLARDFKPAAMQLAAMPVRIEKRRSKGEIYYRVAGILWGGQQTTDRLAIRFGEEQDYVRVDAYQHESNASWTLWTHRWQPESPGLKRIQLRVEDPAIPTNRLDQGYYTRLVTIEEL